LNKHRTPGLISTFALSGVFIATIGGPAIPRSNIPLSFAIQESFPSPPADRTLVYIVDQEKMLRPLAVETGTTPLRVETVAKSDKRSYVELRGVSSSTIIVNYEPRFYLFVPDEASAKPPLVVRMTEKGGMRRVTAMAQKGYRGFAVMSDEIIKPHYRVLSRDGGMIFLEIRLREPLMLGEYAIIGADLQRISTFRIASAPNS